MDESDDATAAAQVAGQSRRISAHTSAASPRRIEVITRTERRRRWSVEQKRAIVAESLAAGSTVLGTARKYGISSGQLYLWRSQFRRRELADASNPAGGFVRLEAPAATQGGRGTIEIALPHGVVLRVDAAVDTAALRRVLEALSEL